jgi:hypothetical protein
MGAHVLLLFAVNSNQEQKGDSLGLKPATFGTLSHLSDCSVRVPPPVQSIKNNNSKANNIEEQ